jgi:hypothetical protein
MGKTFSIRAPLQGELMDFLNGSGIACVHIAELVRDITCLLASYREEDVPMFPDVFVLTDLANLASISPGTERVTIRAGISLNNAAEPVLKDCASLAVKGWSVYVGKTADNVAEYGLFRSAMHSFATTAEEMMIEQGEVPMVLVRNRGRLVVELRNSKNETLTASFTSAPAAESPFAQQVSTFAETAASALRGPQVHRFQQYLSRLLTDLLQHCHGTLLMVHSIPQGDQAPEQLSSGVWLKKSVDLFNAYVSALDAQDASSLARLSACEVLLGGMIGSDGVVVFGDNGSVLGYRIFLKPTDDEKKALPEEGGGRRRTYALMQSRLGEQVKATFFRSQDGHTECDRVQS